VKIFKVLVQRRKLAIGAIKDWFVFPMLARLEVFADAAIFCDPGPFLKRSTGIGGTRDCR
jgi:hypothetical protein